MRHQIQLPVTYDSLRQAGFVEGTTHTFTGEASSLGLPVGRFPDSIETTIGNGMPLIGRSRRIEDGDLIYCRYRQANGCIELVIYND